MPAVSEPPLPHTWRPLGVRLAMLFFGSLLVIVCVAGWIAVGPDVRGRVDIFQRVTFLLLGGLALAVAWALVRCRVTATERGLEIVNGYRRRVYEWAEVVAVQMPRGAPFATLDLADGTSMQALGIQAADGDRARNAVRQLRLLLDRSSGEESVQRPDPPGD
jgi:Bacterial PH domain